MRVLAVRVRQLKSVFVRNAKPSADLTMDAHELVSSQFARMLAPSLSI